MRRLTALVTLSLGGAFVWMGVAVAQFGRGGGWTANGADAQRSFWVRTDPKISQEALQKPGFQFIWKIKLNNQPVQLNAITPAMTLEGYIGYRGFRTLAHMGGSSNSLYAVDTDLGRLEWEKHLSSGTVAAGTPACPGGMTSEIARPTSLAFPAMAAGGRGGGGNRGGARSGVGEPDQGAITLAAAAAPPRMPPPGAAPGRGANRGGGGGGGRIGPNSVYSITADGKLHSVFVSNGEESEPTMDFVPSGSNPHGLIVADNIAYAVTTEGCGGGAALYALDMTAKKVSTWKPESGAIAGTLGTAFDPEGNIYVATTNGDLVKLDGKTLEKKDWYSGGKPFATSPMLFENSEKVLVAAAGKDGTVYLFDAGSLGGADHKTSMFSSAAGSGELAPTALSSWQDGDGNRFVLAPGSDGVISGWKLSFENGKPMLKAAWKSRAMTSPATPIIINGVVFALSTGEYRGSEANLSAADRARKSSPAVLYALDGSTGKELWNSGKTMTSFTHGGLSGSGSQVYVETYDGTMYAFGYYIEH